MKRFLKGLSLAGLAAVVLTLGACDITSLNEDPNEPTTVTTPSLLTNAQTDLANIYWDDYPGGFWIRYAQYWTTNQYTEADRFEFPSRRSSSNDANWNGFYLVLNDLQEIIRINRETPGESEGFGPPENQIAIAKIMQAFTWQMMTDIWGPIPFEEALQGRQQDNFAPSYTSQETVYRSLIDSLTAASDMITDESALAGSDVVYGGDMSQWKKLANSLKMRVAMRMSDQLPGEAETAINEAIAAGAMESNDDNAAIPFSGAPPYQNPFYENYEVTGRDDWAAPEPILGLMNENEDPRRAAYFTDADPDTEGNQFNPFPYGVSPSNAQSLFQSASFSRPSERVRSEAAAPAFIMLYDEVLFIKAEAAERDFISGDAASFYEDAIEASMNRWGVTEQDAIDAYISRVPYDEDNFEQVIGEQKWLAQYMQGIQGWSTWRRLDVQEVLQVPEGNPGQELFGCDFPLRMSYPAAEATLNPEARQNAVDEFLDGADTQGEPGLWWDVETPSCNG